jgi:hypothetical protein
VTDTASLITERIRVLVMDKGLKTQICEFFYR